MKNFQARQDMLEYKCHFKCFCEICKKGPEGDISDFEEYEKLMENAKSLQSVHKGDGCMYCAPNQPSRFLDLVSCDKKAFNLAKKNQGTFTKFKGRLLTLLAWCEKFRL